MLKQFDPILEKRDSSIRELRERILYLYECLRRFGILEDFNKHSKYKWTSHYVEMCGSFCRLQLGKGFKKQIVVDDIDNASDYISLFNSPFLFDLVTEAITEVTDYLASHVETNASNIKETAQKINFVTKRVDKIREALQ